MGLKNPVTLTQFNEIYNMPSFPLSRVLVIGNSPVEVYNIRYHLKTLVAENENLPPSSFIDYPPEGEKSVQLSKIYSHLNRTVHQENLLVPAKKYYFIANIVENTQESKSAQKQLELFVREIIEPSSHGFMIFHVEDPYSYSFLFARKKNPLYSYFMEKGVVFSISLPNALFSFTDSFLSKDLQKTYRLWKDLQKKKEEPRKLLIMLVRSLRYLLQCHCCHDAETMKDVSRQNNLYAQHPYVIKKNRRFAENFSKNELLEILFNAYEVYTYLSPTQEDKIGFDPEEIFERFLIQSLAVLS